MKNYLKSPSATAMFLKQYLILKRTRLRLYKTYKLYYNEFEQKRIIIGVIK